MDVDANERAGLTRAEGEGEASTSAGPDFSSVITQVCAGGGRGRAGGQGRARDAAHDVRILSQVTARDAVAVRPANGALRIAQPLAPDGGGGGWRRFGKLLCCFAPGSSGYFKSGEGEHVAVRSAIPLQPHRIGPQQFIIGPQVGNAAAKGGGDDACTPAHTNPHTHPPHRPHPTPRSSWPASERKT
jgi:hypothetical protein